MYHPPRRLLSSARCSDIPTTEPETAEKDKRGRRVWKAREELELDSEATPNNEDGSTGAYHAQHDHWDTAVDDVNDRRVVDESLSRICEQVCASCIFLIPLL